MQLTPLLLLLVSTCAEGSNCPDDWVGHGKSCYMFISSQQTWSDSHLVCARHGGALTQIETAEENSFLRGYLKLFAALGGDMTIWTGGNDKVQEGGWEWLPSGQKMTFTDWGNYQPGGNVTENCLEMSKDYDFHWNDAPCTNRYRAMCEIPDVLPTDILIG